MPLFLLAFLSFNTLITAQSAKIPGVTRADKQASESEPKAVSPEQQREAAKRLLAEAERDRQVAAQYGISSQDVKERYGLLDGLVTCVSSQLSLIDEREVLQHSRNAIALKTESWAGFSRRSVPR